MYARMLVFDMYGAALAAMPVRVIVSGVAFTLTQGGWQHSGTGMYTWAGMIAALSGISKCHDVSIERVPNTRSERCCAHTLALSDALLAMAEILMGDDDEFLLLRFETAMTL